MLIFFCINMVRKVIFLVKNWLRLVEKSGQSEIIESKVLSQKKSSKFSFLLFANRDIQLDFQFKSANFFLYQLNLQNWT